MAAFPSVEAIRILAARSHVVLYGDQALLELGARRAAQFDQLVGPYSRSGFHHPGPAVLYLLAPFVRLLEPTGPGLYLGAVVINGAALVAAVAVLRRRTGPLAALWAAAAVGLFCLCVGVGTLREPWNPYLVVAPMVLFAVLWAAGVTGSTGAAVWALVVGSYQLQTHIATAPLVLTMVVILLVRAPMFRRGRGPTRGPAVVTGVVALAVIWLPPMVELFRDRPNNIRLLWNFFTSAHATPPLGRALQASASAVSIMPFGNHDYVLMLDRAPFEIAVAAVLLVAGVIAAFGLGRRRGQPMTGPLATSAVLGIVIGTLSLMRTDGPVYAYFAVWLAYVPLSVVLALGVALLGTTGPDVRRSAAVPPTAAAPPPPTAAAPPTAAEPPLASPPGRAVAPRLAIAACIVLAVTVGASNVRSDLNMGPVSTTTGSGPWPPGNARTAQGRARTIQVTFALTRAAAHVLGPRDRVVGFSIGSGAVWPYAAGMVLELDERGVQSTVAPAAWELYFGHERGPGRPVTVAFNLDLGDAGTAGAAPPGTVIADIDGVVLTYTRTGA